MFGLPIGLLIRIGLVIAAAAAAAYLWHEFTGHYEDIGRKEVQAKWDADKVRRIALTTAQTNLWDQQRQKTEATERERDQARGEAFAAVKENHRLTAEVAATRVPGTFVGVLRAASDQANAAGGSGKPDPAAAPAAAGADDSTLGLLADWYAQVAEIHAECRDRVAAWQAFYDGLRAVQPKEQL